MVDFVELYIGKSRDYLNFMLALAKDDQGRDILVGLTRAESEFYCEQSVGRMAGASRAEIGPEADAKWIALHDKHEQARFIEIAKDYHRRHPQA